MTMETLKLEHIAPYLPYELLIDDSLTTAGYTEKIMTTTTNIACYVAIDNVVANNFKPILRPLSDLTKPIQHNGEEFVPLMLLFSCSVKEEEAFEIYGTVPEYWSVIMKTDIKNDLEYRFMLRLFEWRFDVFSLIEKGLAIDVNTLSENPYK